MKPKRLFALVLSLALLSICPIARAEAAPYYIDVDVANQIVTVYENGKHRDEENIVRQMICSSGVGNSTPTGTFTLPEKKYSVERTEWYYFTEYEIWAKYATRIHNRILFHSILFAGKGSGTPTWASNHSLGSKASHGCVRLRVEDAKWIAENCPTGTVVHIFDDAEADEELRSLLKILSFDCDAMPYDEFLKYQNAIHKGSEGEDVRAIQQKLSDLGYEIEYIDGIFGSATESLVCEWQHSRGLYQSSILTDEQREMLMAQETAVPTPSPSPTPSPAPSPTPIPSPTPSPTPDISGMKGTIALVAVDEESYLALRDGPNVNKALLATLTRGTPLRVLNEGLVWSLVEYDGKQGYVGSRYIEIVCRETETEESEP